MPEEQIRQLERRVKELEDFVAQFFGSDRFNFFKNVHLQDGRSIQVGIGTGTKIGTGATQKLGFFNASPVAQQAAFVAANSQGSTYNQTDVQSIADTANNCRNALRNLGFVES